MTEMPTSDATSAADAAADPAADAAPRRRRRKPLGRPRATLLIVGWVVVLVSILLWLVPLPYYTLAPGRSENVAPLLDVEGVQTYPHEGEFLFTTVSVTPVNGWELLRSFFDSHDVLVASEQINGDQSPDEVRRVNSALMENSKTVATIVALERLGYTAVPTGSGAEVVSVADGKPAAGLLEADDVITAVDGAPVKTVQDATSILGSHRPGDTVTLSVRRGDQNRDVAVTMAQRSAEEPEKAVVGVTLQTADFRVDTPFPIEITTQGIGGPSAGLAYTLGIIDDLTPDDLAGGARVAATGEIEPDGSVGPIGGIQQKVYSVEAAGADLFLVPTANYDDAVAVATKVEVVPVADIDAALAALDRHRSGA
ncbi:MAG: PDZ domain-containing protein [Acidimicrobiia bacterium]|nr:PDZ domain-containing protein [Acidimicrobiia bacterium]